MTLNILASKKLTHLAFASVLALVAQSSFAQTKIQCQFNAGANQFEAPLAWQNTLGKSRANSMCSAAGAPDPTNQMNGSTNFQITDGDRASEVIRKWSSARGFAFVWDAPAQSDLVMLAGAIEATDLPGAVGKLIVGLNTKIASQRKANSSDNQFAFPIQAVVYSNKVIAITLK